MDGHGRRLALLPHIWTAQPRRRPVRPYTAYMHLQRASCTERRAPTRGADGITVRAVELSGGSNAIEIATRHGWQPVSRPTVYHQDHVTDSRKV